MFDPQLDRADNLLRRMRGKDEALRHHAVRMIPAVDTICRSLEAVTTSYPLMPLLSAIEPERRHVMAASFKALSNKATDVVIGARAADCLAERAGDQASAADMKAQLIGQLVVQSLFALVSLRPVLEQLHENTEMNHRIGLELNKCLDLLDALIAQT